MNATGLYCSASRIIFQADTNAPTNDQRLPDLYRLVPYLRQSLSCAVCGRLLSDPYVTKDGKCQHNVCRLCVRGRKNIKPSCFACKDCQDFRTYEENRQMRCLLQCYKSLCEHLMSTPLYSYICKQKIPTSAVSCGITIPNLTLVEFIVEGANFEDVLLAFATDLPKTFSKYAQVTSTVGTQSPLATFLPNAMTQISSLTPITQSTQQNSIQVPVVIKQEFHSPSDIVTPPLPAVTIVSNKSGLSPSPSSTYSSLATTNSANLVQTIAKPLFATQQHRNVIAVSTATTTATESKPVSLKMTPLTTMSKSAATACPTIRNPPPIKTVSNGSAMYSVLYTGIGNKITIKRKTNGDEDNALGKNIQTSQTPTVFRQVSKQSPKRRGCRCGNATPTPGKLTCCGQRCPCYVDSKSCINCKCRGCRNPHRPDGGKVRPIIPELACYEIQLADDSTNLSPNDLPIATTNKRNSISSVPASTVSSSLNRIELPLDDFSTSRIAVTSGITQSGSSSNNTIIKMKSQQTVTYTGTSTHSQQQALQPHHHVQLENLSRESLLIQSAQGNYQVVNVFTAAPNQNTSASVQGIHSVSTLPNSNIGGATGNNSFIIPITHQNTTTVSRSPSSSLHQIPEISTTLPQIIMQQQQQQRRTVSSSTSIGSHQQQQQHQQHNIKTNNIITVHPLTQKPIQQNQKRSHHLQQHHHLQSLSSSMSSMSPTPTITLSPIIVASPNNFSSDLFPDEDYLANTTSSTGSVASNGSVTQSHMAMSASSENSPISITSSAQHPPLLELVETSDL